MRHAIDRDWDMVEKGGETEKKWMKRIVANVAKDKKQEASLEATFRRESVRGCTLLCIGGRSDVLEFRYDATTRPQRHFALADDLHLWLSREQGTEADGTGSQMEHTHNTCQRIGQRERGMYVHSYNEMNVDINMGGENTEYKTVIALTLFGLLSFSTCFESHKQKIATHIHYISSIFLLIFIFLNPCAIPLTYWNAHFFHLRSLCCCFNCLHCVARIKIQIRIFRSATDSRYAIVYASRCLHSHGGRTKIPKWLKRDNKLK